MLRFTVSVLALTLASCTHIDTGQVDYRLADRPKGVTLAAPEETSSSCVGGKPNSACDPVLLSGVTRRYVPENAAGWDAFKKGQVYSIEIEQGMVGKNILEGKIGGVQIGKTAEIAVLANVFEFASEAGDAATHRFLESGELAGKADDPSDVELKLIYFGDDIQRRQAFNFSNIPLRARTSYGGGSIGIQLVVMEVDAQAGPVASLLKTLARFGQQALPGPGEAKDILYDLGESLLSGSKDDRLLEYRFVLSAGAEDPMAVQATFAPGRYVVRRSQERDVSMRWSELRLDHNTGRLFRENGASPDLQEVRDDLYMVVNVRRYPDGTKPEFYTQKDWSTFRDALQTSANDKAAPLDRVTERLVGLLEDGRSNDWRDALLLKWSTAANRLDLFTTRYSADFSQVISRECPVDAVELQRRLDLAEREAQTSINAFRAEYQAAAAAKRSKAAAGSMDEFRPAERDRVLNSVANYFMPWSKTGAKQDLFASPAQFEAAFIDKAVGDDLIVLALASAKAKSNPSASCASLISR